MTVWLDLPGDTLNLAGKCADDATDLGARIHEKRKQLRALLEHGRGDCPTARNLRAQIADLRAQQKQWDDGAAALRGGLAVGIDGRRRRGGRSAPPRGW